MSKLKESLEFRAWAIDQHRDTNHKYDEILPYEFHLNMVAREVNRHLDFGKDQQFPGLNPVIARDILLDAAYGHDLIEDTRTNYNDILRAGASHEVADIIFALTDRKGRNRGERAPKEHYEEMVLVPGASFVKFCDRIANVRYSKFMESPMFDMYKKENQKFMSHCYVPMLKSYKVADTLNGLFK